MHFTNHIMTILSIYFFLYNGSIPYNPRPLHNTNRRADKIKTLYLPGLTTEFEEIFKEYGLKSGAATIAKFLMWVLKKLQRPTNDRIVLTSAGILAVSMAFSLFLPGLMPSGVRVNPR